MQITDVLAAEEGLPVTPDTSRTLKQSLGMWDVVVITVSGVTPASSLFVIAPFAIQQAGSGVLLSFVLGGVLAFAFALCYAELGAAHRSAGGEYVMTKRVFGALPGYLIFIAMLAVCAFIPVVLASGAARYLNNALDTDFSDVSVALVMMVAAYVVGTLNIRINAWITGAFLAGEVLVMMLIAYLGLSSPHRPISALITPEMPINGALVPVTLAALIPAVGTAIFCFNGFGAAVLLAEDLEGGNREVARSVIYSLLAILLVELIPLTGIVIGAPSLVELSNSADPVGYVIGELSSPEMIRVVSAGIFLAVFNAIIAIVIQIGRLLYSSGRHALWLRGCNRAFTHIHPKLDSPWLATLVMAIPSTLLLFVSSLCELTAFTVDLLLMTYIAIGLAALLSRVIRRDVEHPYRMPLWPVPPLVAIVGASYTLYTTLAAASGPRDLYIIGGLLLSGLAMYWVWARHSMKFREI